MIIDTHVHIGGRVAGFNMTEDMVIEAMSKYGIDFAIVSNADAVEVNHRQRLITEKLQISQEEALLKTIDFANKFPNKIGVAPWVKPLTQGLTKELEKIISDNSRYKLKMMQEEQLFPVFVTLLQEIIVFLHRKYQIIEDNIKFK